MKQDMAPRAVDETAAARYIGMSVAYLRMARSTGDLSNRTPAPKFLKIGRTVRYLVEDLNAWLESHRAGGAAQ